VRRSYVFGASILVVVVGPLRASADANEPAIPSCETMVSKTVTLHGKLSTVIDNGPPIDDPKEIVGDVWQRVFVLTLKTPMCSNSEETLSHKVVGWPKVVTVELAPGTGLTWNSFKSRVGKVIAVRGTLSENPWWQYRSPMLLTASTIE
jgi:hypothetical protein